MADLFTPAERQRLCNYLDSRRQAERLIGGAKAAPRLKEIDEVEALLDREERSTYTIERLRSWADGLAHHVCARLIAGDLPAAEDAAQTYRLLDMLWQAR